MTKQEIKNKLQTGDWKTLGDMLGVLPDAARMRFNRDEPEAIEAAKKLVSTREKLIKDYQK